MRTFTYIFSILHHFLYFCPLTWEAASLSARVELALERFHGMDGHDHFRQSPVSLITRQKWRLIFLSPCFHLLSVRCISQSSPVNHTVRCCAVTFPLRRSRLCSRRRIFALCETQIFSSVYSKQTSHVKHFPFSVLEDFVSWRKNYRTLNIQHGVVKALQPIKHEKQHAKPKENIIIVI